jgi:hypothetical protein
MIFLRWFIAFQRLFRVVRCPQCGAYSGHAPNCAYASRRELEHAYNWTQGQLAEERNRSSSYIKTWANAYEREKAQNKALAHENNRLRKARYPGK